MAMKIIRLKVQSFLSIQVLKSDGLKRFMYHLRTHYQVSNILEGRVANVFINKEIFKD